MWKIKKCSFAACAIVLMVVLFHYTSVYADDASLGRTPEGVFPIQENDVIMESEEITVDLEKNSVECIFIFHNTGKSKDVYMGFPGKLDKKFGSDFSEDVDLELGQFKTFVKGKELFVNREKSVQPYNTEALDASRYREWFTFTVPFKSDEKVTVRNTYNFRPSYYSNGDVSNGYVLRTGALWKGSIGSAKVTFKLGKIQPYQIEQLQPDGYRFVGDKLIWEGNSFEPNYDLTLYYNTYHYSEEFLKETTDEYTASIKEKIDSYNMVKALADKNETNKLLALYYKAAEEKDSVLALYIKSFLHQDIIFNAKNNSSNLIFVVLSGTFLMGLIAILIVILRKNQQK